MNSQYYQNAGFSMEVTAEDTTVLYESTIGAVKSIKAKSFEFVVDQKPIFHMIDGVDHLAVISSCKKSMYGVKLGETRTNPLNFLKETNFANFQFMFIPVNSITKFKATLFNRDNSELISNLPDYLAHFQ